MQTIPCTQIYGLRCTHRVHVVHQRCVGVDIHQPPAEQSEDRAALVRHQQRLRQLLQLLLRVCADQLRLQP